MVLRSHRPHGTTAGLKIGLPGVNPVTILTGKAAPCRYHILVFVQPVALATRPPSTLRNAPFTQHLPCTHSSRQFKDAACRQQLTTRRSVSANGMLMTAVRAATQAVTLPRVSVVQQRLRLRLMLRGSPRTAYTE
jgi:hypothetical protein